MLIDPVIVCTEPDLEEVRRLGLKLAHTVDTHIHADHITAALEMKKVSGSKTAAQPLIAGPAPMSASTR